MSEGPPLGVVPPLAEDGAGLPGPGIGEPVLDREARHRPFRALRRREFRLLFSAYAIGDVGFWISHISLQSEMARVTDSSSLWLGVLFFSTFIPMLVFAPAAGVVADRVDRKRMLVVTRVLVGLLATTLAALVLSEIESAAMLSGFGFLLGTLFAFMAPAQLAATANSVPPSDLSSAISLESAGNNLSRIAGPALAAPILATWGAGWAFAVYALSNALMVATLLPIRLTRQPRSPDDGSAWQRWKDGLRHARDRPPAVAALVTMSVFSVFGAAHVALYPVFTTQVLDHPRTDFTMLVIASGIGAVVGALSTGFRRTVPTLRTAAIWVVGFGLFAAAFALSTSWTLSLVLLVGVGFCYFSTTTSLNTMLQHLADDDKRGRIMGLFTLTWAGLIPFGGIWMGAVADVSSAPVAVALGATVCLAYGLTIIGLRLSTRPPTARDATEGSRGGQVVTEPPR
ncbi:MAG: MFS transporter [Acidimicrobiia bacterium]